MYGFKLFKNQIPNLKYSDIEELKNNQIAESEILDYKDRRIDNENIIKEINAFSNTRGGFLIYGIKETGKGGYPESINGIDDTNKESLEQFIIGNVKPRISVQIQILPIPKSDKIILIIHVPEGQNKPYYNNKTNKYHKRYNFEAKEMDEPEIEALYQKRFFGVAKLAKYIDDTILFKRSKLPKDSPNIDSHIIITPLRIDDRIIDTSNKGQIDFNPNNIRLEPRSNEPYLLGFSNPSRYGIQWRDRHPLPNVEVHRNGFIHYISDEYGGGSSSIWEFGLARDLLKTIQFANIVYSKSNFIGKVKIIFKVMNSANSEIIRGGGGLDSMSSHYKCDSEEIYIEIEWDSWKLKEDYLEIGKNIMDEFSNYYGLWNSNEFTKENGIIKFSSEE